MVRIIIDSACDLPKSQADKLNLDFLPLKTIFGDEEFLDGIDLTKDDFYTKLEDIPWSLQCPMNDILENILRTTSSPFIQFYFMFIKYLMKRTFRQTC